MPIKKKNPSQDVLKVNSDDRFSRFVVDLRSHQDDSGKEEKKKSWSFKILVFIRSVDWKEKFFSFHQKTKSFLNQNKKLKNPFLNNQGHKDDLVSYKIRDFLLWYGNRVEMILSQKEGRFSKLEKLAFFGILKIFKLLVLSILRIIYRVCYGVGWIILFLVRFTFFFFYKIFFALANKFLLVKRLFVGLIITVNVVLAILSWIVFLPNKFFSKINFSRPRRSISNIASDFKDKLPKPRRRKLKKFLPSWKIKAPHFLKIRFSRPSFLSKIYHKIFPKRLKFLKKKYFSFAIFLVFLSLPFVVFSYYRALDTTQNRVLGVAEAAVGDLQGAAEAAVGMDFSQASQNFSQASQNFLKAEEELREVNKALLSLASLSDNKKLQLASQAEKIVTAGRIGSDLGKNISLALESAFNSPEGKVLDMIDDFVYYGQSAKRDAEELNELLAQIDLTVLPPEHQEQFLALKKQANYIESGLSDLISIASQLDEFLGANENKRYLFVFQNNTELRATGGFIGSYALIDFKNGKITNLEVPAGGSYDTEGGLRELVIAPEPLHLVNPLWHFWDANWWPDWPRSSEKLMWFYEKSGGPTVDGVISFTPTVIEKILSVLGPIDMSEDYGVVLDEENFWLTVQDIVERKEATSTENVIQDNKPKKIIGDLMEKMIEELPQRLNQDNLTNLFDAIEESLRQKHILFYFVDEDLESYVDEQGWSGRIKDVDSNYLSVINTNIAGGKSDKSIIETINHRTEIHPDGEVVNILQIKRQHTGAKGDVFSGVRNVDWMRIYVPWGSKLLEARGFNAPDDIYFEEPDLKWQEDEDIARAKETERPHKESGTLVYDELGKTVFANWSMVDPGETTTIYLKYKLPFSLRAQKQTLIDKLKQLINPTYDHLYPYSLYIQKQAGAKPSHLNTSLVIQGDHQVLWGYPKEANISSAGWKFEGELDNDKFQSILLAK